MTHFFVKTLGCKVNQCDTQDLREEFTRRGCRQTGRPRDARLLIINTCCVTHQADRKSRQAIRQAARSKKKGAWLAVVGCYPGYDSKEISSLTGVDAVFSNTQRRDFWRWVDQRLVAERRRQEPDARFMGRTRAFLKIQEGCDNHCSYCVVPHVRGPSQSVPFKDILARARRLTEAGHNEIVLTGVNLGAYRVLGNGRHGLLEVIDALVFLPGLARLRLSSIEAPDVTQDLIDRMASSGKLCRHLHIPFQSGDDGILRHMGRRARVADYLDLVDRIRRRVPDVAITCDVIVGYPMETAQSFLNTCSFLEQVEPLRTHLFTFSPRRGTRLEAMGMQPLDARLVRERRRRLEELTKNLSLRFKRRFLGKRLDVLVEGRHKGRWVGYSGNYLRVGLRSDMCLSGEIVPVTVEDLDGEGAIGHICRRSRS